MTVELDRETLRLIEEEIRSGRHRSAGDVVLDALRLMEEQTQLLLGRKEEIRKGIAAGLESLRRGKGVDGEAVFDRIESELDSLERSSRQ
jgi:antitoxin ParD1/3/4